MSYRDSLKEIGQKVRIAREKAGMSQSELASAIGREQARISEVERGVANPTFRLLYEISEALGTPVKELIG